MDFIKTGKITKIFTVGTIWTYKIYISKRQSDLNKTFFSIDEGLKWG